jgi:phospho-acceptor domain-containing protein
LGLEFTNHIIGCQLLGRLLIGDRTILNKSLELSPVTRHNACATNNDTPTKKQLLLKRTFGDSMPDTNSAPKPIPANPEDQVVFYRQRLDDVAELVARIRHEINNPLTGVLGQAQLLLREELSDRARKRAQTIEDLAIRIRDIVAQLRDVQKP